MRAAIIEQTDDGIFVVTNIIEVTDVVGLNDYKNNTGVDIMIDVNYNVSIGNTYDPETGIIYNSDKARVFPPISADDQIADLKQSLVDQGFISFIEYDKLASSKDKYDAKIREVKRCCKKSIEAGYDVEISENEILHFSLTEYRQKDLEDNYFKIRQGAEFVFFRDDSKIMVEKYSAEKFLKVYEVLTNKMFADKVYSDGLETLLTELYTTGLTFDDVIWGTTLPNYIQDVVDDLVAENEAAKKELLAND